MGFFLSSSTVEKISLYCAYNMHSCCFTGMAEVFSVSVFLLTGGGGEGGRVIFLR